MHHELRNDVFLCIIIEANAAVKIFEASNCADILFVYC